MIINWLLEDPKEAAANFLCSGCQRRIDRGEDFYLAKKGGRDLKLCEECASEAEVEDDNYINPQREEWLGEI